MIVYTTNIKEHDNWAYVEEIIKKINKKGIFVSFCDSYFTENTQPITELWYGIIHNPFDWEKYTPWDKTNLFTIKSFIESLKFCKVLFVMAETQIIHIKGLLKAKGVDHISVFSLIHPIRELNYAFNYYKYLHNDRKTLYSVGNWLRKQYTIFKLECSNKFHKAIIPFTTRTKTELKYYIRFDKINMTKNEYDSVMKVSHVNKDHYHKIFENNLVLLDVYLTTINNTLLECIIANTPIILNRNQEYIDLLGEDYPLFFDHMEQISSLIEDDNNIFKAHVHLKSMDKTKFSFSYFQQVIEKYIDTCV